jgi:peptidoglycan/LPS O-acetylase OafA/YrhL
VSGATGDRVLGWDLLRGLCALTVATYHLLYWLKIAELPALGTYGVYLFFVLSGASLAYNYDAGRLRGVGDVGRFLFARWMRLAPLYLLLCPVYISMLALHNGGWMDSIGQRMALNATFAFGLWDPAVTALLIGGWSLGIEFVYYLFFPLIVRVLHSPALRNALFVLLVAVQWYWIYATVGAKGWMDGVVGYHQVPAFFAYFFGGCIIGHLRRERDRMLPMQAGLGVWIAMAALLFALMPRQAGDELLGARGAALFAACFFVVSVSGQVVVRGWARALAAWLGDVTYGCYLLHPIVLWTVLWFLLPGAIDVSVPRRVGVLVAVLALTCVLASCSDGWIERPVRKWLRGSRLSPRA